MLCFSLLVHSMSSPLCVYVWLWCVAVHIHCGLRWNSALLATQTMSEPRELVQPQRSRVVAHTVGM